MNENVPVTLTRLGRFTFIYYPLLILTVALTSIIGIPVFIYKKVKQ